MYLESLVCSSFCPHITQIRGKAQKKRYFFFSVTSYAVGMPVLKTLSCEKCVSVTHIQHEAGLSQLVCLNTSEHHAEVLAALGAIWAITALLSLNGACWLKDGQVHVTESYPFVDGAQLVGVWDPVPCSNLLSSD